MVGMPRLRLTQPHEQFDASEEADVLRFPAEALAEARARHAAPNLKQGLSDPTRRLITRVDAILDDMQKGLNSLKDRVENYRFPGLPAPGDRKPAA